MSTVINAPISSGELLDKLTILSIKEQWIKDEGRLALVRDELRLLGALMAAHIPNTTEIAKAYDELREVNATLWTVEDRLRELEKEGRFDAEFVDLARSVYQTNDLRAAIKLRINQSTNSRIVEVKSYAGG